MNSAIQRAIAAIPDTAWTPVRYPGAVEDPDTGELISEAEVAETGCAALAHNLLRAAGSLASVFHAKARGATLRRHLICVPARLARPQGRPTLHLPEHWPWADTLTALHTATTGP